MSFPAWAVRNAIMRFRGRLNHDSLPVAPNQILSWSRSYRYNHAKLYYRLVLKNYKRTKRTPATEWHQSMSYQKAKIQRYHDEFRFWRETENRILTRLNQQPTRRPTMEFWQYALNNQAKKLRKLGKKGSASRRVVQREWIQVILASRQRLRRGDSLMRPEDTGWERNLQYNRAKLQSIHRSIHWNYTVATQRAKFIRSGESSSKTEF